MPKVYLVGAGPGDPNLLTCKAFQLLRKADVIVYDRLVSAEVLAVANPSALLIFAGKLQGEQERIQTEIHAHLLAHAAEGRTVIRLKGGDPMVFGRGAEEWSFLNKNGIDVELVPGISASLAVPALAGIPVTLRGVATSFAVIAGHRQNMEPQEWSRYLLVDTLVVLMGVSNRGGIAANLIRAGRSVDEPVAFIERGATERERVVVSTLREVARGRVDVANPAVMVIGQVVRMRRQLKRRMSEAVPAAMETVHVNG
ncbi:MAG TPA: uroporphyrinogen-III C-methyltransferase [Bryobacteraceae bacterium]|nr:uroporphyrinogen-III C-methyltransferase [Bryobacteraceae bacterium]